MNTDQITDRNEIRHFRADDRYDAKLDSADHLIGELCREGKTVYYINLLTLDGRFTGKTKESTSHTALCAYAVRNHYV